ncbi:ABC transporter permease [Xylophilus sp. GOD-11R]|uniref:ABC transporter permease n=1 Tax=Xylophilus sp. GOD-11R TaxID=3089814 RepID=UPI00298C2ACC|nr:ABC transporter permease [Xylophilus sp. GOD-11R]WPB59190.1 ABC transporter permease [Xylophilus sp. GOD-11R]
MSYPATAPVFEAGGRQRRKARMLAFNDAFLGLVSLAGFLLVWHVVATSFFQPQFFPGPLVVARTAVEMIGSGELFGHVAISMQRILLGFVIGSVVAIPIGLLLGTHRTMRKIFAPYTQFFRFVPAIAWLTPVVIWFGIGELSKVLIIVYTTVFIVVINTMVGVSSISPNKMRAAQSLGASPGKIFWYVTLPAALPFALTGMRIAMGNSFMVVVSAEMVSAESGLGYLIFNSRLWMATDQIFIAILCLGGFGILTDWVFRILIRRLVSHYGVVE